MIPALTISEIVLRLAVSVLLGGAVGLERRYHDKPAGFTTNTIICVGATVFSMVSLYCAQAFGADPARIAAQIVAGVGFLGAGSILRDGNKISGLTTAASIWLVAAIGTAVGFGAFLIAGYSTLAVLAVQFVVRNFMDLFDSVRMYESIVIKCEPDWSVVEKINHTITKNKAKILKEEVYKEQGLFVISLAVIMSTKTLSQTFRELLSIKEIKFLDK
jgi:putative Mg2+ transporter-C (MgtC) family protein